MTAESFSLLSWIFFGLSGACLITGIVLFVVFKIPSVIGDLSGHTAKKSIDKMWDKNTAKNEKTNKKQKNANKPVAVRRTNGSKNDMVETGLLVENRKNIPEVSETELLTGPEMGPNNAQSQETEWLTGNQPVPEKRKPNVIIDVIEEIVLIETKEVL